MTTITTLKRNSDFVRLYKRGKYHAGKYLVLYFRENGTQKNRIGITASRKYGGSVRRNRIRRLIKESYRQLEGSLKDGFDFVFVARSITDAPAGYREVSREMRYLLNKASLYRKERS